jgi:hypothetical protein
MSKTPSLNTGFTFLDPSVEDLENEDHQEPLGDEWVDIKSLPLLETLSEPPPKNVSKDEATFIQELQQLLDPSPRYASGKKLSIRCFMMPNSKVFLGFLLQEIEDSFVVALPSVLAEDQLGLQFTVDIPFSPIVRLSKSGAMVGIPNLETMHTFLVGSQSKLGSIPGFFNEARKEQIRTLIEKLEQTPGVQNKRLSEKFIDEAREIGKTRSDGKNLRGRGRDTESHIEAIADLIQSASEKGLDISMLDLDGPEEDEYDSATRFKPPTSKYRH